MNYKQLFPYLDLSPSMLLGENYPIQENIIQKGDKIIFVESNGNDAGVEVIEEPNERNEYVVKYTPIHDIVISKILLERNGTIYSFIEHPRFPVALRSGSTLIAVFYNENLTYWVYELIYTKDNI